MMRYFQGLIDGKTTIIAALGLPEAKQVLLSETQELDGYDVVRTFLESSIGNPAFRFEYEILKNKLRSNQKGVLLIEGQLRKGVE